jgi:hypothetical protein
LQPSARPGAPCRIAKAVGAEAGASNARCRAYRHPMRKLKPTEARQRRFQEALADTGRVSAAAVAGTSRTRVYELRKADQAFASAWQEAEEIAADRLEDEAGRRALEGVPELLVSGGKLVRDDEGNPITVRRYSDNLLLALLKAKRPPRRERSVRFQLPALHSAADAAAAMASIAASVAAGEITLGEAADLSRMVEACMRAIEAGEFHERLQSY